LFSFLPKIIIIQLKWTNNHQCISSRWGYSRCFADEPKTHSFPLFIELILKAPRIFQPLFNPKIFSSYLPLPPSYLPPTYLPQLISRSPHLQNLGELPSLSSKKLQGDVKHKAWRRWRAQHWRNVERRR
jgi:hypothetical protein